MMGPNRINKKSDANRKNGVKEDLGMAVVMKNRTGWGS